MHTLSNINYLDINVQLINLLLDGLLKRTMIGSNNAELYMYKNKEKTSKDFT